MNSAVTVVDYGIGNLYSVARALEHVGASAVITDSIDTIMRAERLIIPGVGAFANGIQELTRRKLVDPIKEYARSGRPLLGICLGMQLLFDASDEFGEHGGLGIIPGRVTPIPATGADGKGHKIPHVGWNRLIRPAVRKEWIATLLEGIEEGSCTYFVHSFTAVPADEHDRLADCYYNGRRISAAVKRGTVCGFQFHPEKSGIIGLRILARFVKESIQ
jgi:imidazole glycerol-phosphate synthase subunit HisH